MSNGHLRLRYHTAISLVISHFAIVTIVISCSRSEKPGGDSRSLSANSEAKQFVRLDSSFVAPLAVIAVKEIPLGHNENEFPVSVDGLAINDRRIAIIDRAGRAVRSFDREGYFVFSLSTRKGASGITNPRSVALFSDSMLVMEMNHARGITSINPDGQSMGVLPSNSGASTSTIDVSDSIVAVTSILLDSVLALPTARFLVLSERSGRKVTTACVPDPLYHVSSDRRGFFSLFRGVGARIHRDYVFCRQPISPNVQIFSTGGDSVDVIQLVPPFYMRGKDAPQSMNQLTVNQFSSTWTEHIDFFPFDDGFLSVYAQFDNTQQQRVYHLFRCTKSSSTNYRCGMTSMTERPLALLGKDTIATFVIEKAAGRTPRLRLSKLK